MINVGEKVKIHKRLTTATTGISKIEQYVDANAVVTELVISDGKVIGYRLDIDQGQWIWHESWVELAAKKSRKTKTKKLQS